MFKAADFHYQVDALKSTPRDLDSHLTYYKDGENLIMSGAIVRVYKGNDFVKTYDVPQNVEGTVWHVFDITEDGVISFNEFSYQSAPASVQ